MVLLSSNSGCAALYTVLEEHSLVLAGATAARCLLRRRAVVCGLLTAAVCGLRQWSAADAVVSAVVFSGSPHLHFAVAPWAWQPEFTVFGQRVVYVLL